MAQQPTPAPSSDARRLHLDGTITAGNILTAAAMMVALLAMWFRLEGRVDAIGTLANMHGTRIDRLEQKDQADSRELGAVREGLAQMKAQTEAILRAVMRLETTMDQQGGRR